jgi:hypothetical protein
MFSHIKRHHDPELRYSARSKCFRSYDPEAKSYTDLSDEPMIVDLGTVRHGWERLATGKKREIALAYVNELLPPQPSPDHQMVGAVRVVVASLGRCTIMLTRTAWLPRLPRCMKSTWGQQKPLRARFRLSTSLPRTVPCLKSLPGHHATSSFLATVSFHYPPTEIFAGRSIPTSQLRKYYDADRFLRQRDAIRGHGR